MQLFNFLSLILQKARVGVWMLSKGPHLHRKTIYNSFYRKDSLPTRMKSILDFFKNNLNSKQSEIHSPTQNVDLRRLKFANSYKQKDRLVNEKHQDNKIINQEKQGHPKQIPQKTSDYEDLSVKSYARGKTYHERFEVNIKNKGQNDIQKPQNTQPQDIDIDKKPIEKKNQKQQPIKKPSPYSDRDKYSFSSKKDSKLNNINKFSYKSSVQSKDSARKRIQQKFNQYLKVKKYYQTGQNMDQTMSEQLQDTLQYNKGNFLKSGKPFQSENSSYDNNKQIKDESQKDENKKKIHTVIQKKKVQIASDIENDRANFEFEHKNFDTGEFQNKIQVNDGVRAESLQFTQRFINKVLDNMQPNSLEFKKEQTYRQDFSKFNKRYSYAIRSRIFQQEDIVKALYPYRVFEPLNRQINDRIRQQFKEKEKNNQRMKTCITQKDLQKWKNEVEDSLPSYK